MLDLLYLIFILAMSYFAISFLVGFILSILAMIYSIFEFLFTTDAGKPWLYAIIIILIIVTIL